MLLLITLLISVLDIAIATLLLCQGINWSLFLKFLLETDYQHNFLDLWYLSILRFCFATGIIIGLKNNKTRGQEFMKNNTWVGIATMVVLALYGCTKLLIYSEQDEFVAGGRKRKFFWGLFAWSEIFCIFPIYIWMKLSSHDFNERPLVVEEDVTDRRPLLQSSNSVNHEGENHASPGKENKESAESSTSRRGSTSNKSDSVDPDEIDKKGMTKLLNKATVGKILRYTKKDAWLICLGIVFLICASVAEVFIPLYTGKVISGIAIDKDTSKFAKNIIVMAGISIAASVCAGLRGGLMMTAINRMNVRVKNALFQSISKQEMAYYDKTKTGDLISRLTSDTQTMSTSIGLNFNVFLRSLVKAIGTVVFMFKLSWRLSIITFMGLPLVVAVSKLYGNYYKRLQTEVQDKLAKSNEIADEVCSSMKTVRSFANEIGECDRYNVKLLEVYKVQLKQAVAYAGFMWSNEISSLALITGTLGYGGHLVFNDLMDTENLISFILYQLNLGDCLQSMGFVYTGLMQALGAAEKVFQIIEREPHIDLNKGKEEPEFVNGRIKFNDVTFIYPSRPKNTVLKGVTFEAEPGQVTALVGPSGGGKSSCVSLLQHLYEPVSGQVTIDGISVSDFSHKYLHEVMTMVGQEPVLFSRTIRENISYGMSDDIVTERDTVQAAIDANAHQFITELPDQYETETGEKGAQLSGGQKQRVAIARAIVRKPRILLLDEATSALDTESEYLVQQALRHNFKDRTVLIIAHRLSTVEHANKIVVIDKGEVKEQGTHEELMKRNGIYHKLVYRQLHADHHDKKTYKNSSESINVVKKESRTSSGSKYESVSSSLDSNASFHSQIGSLRSRSTLSRSSSSDSVNPFPNI